MSQYCTSYFLFTFNEGLVVLANFKRDFRFCKILHISLYQSFIFFQGHTSSCYLPHLSVHITFICF